MYFSFDFGCILYIFILSVKNSGREAGGGRGGVNGKNPLSVTKVICRQSLTLM